MRALPTWLPWVKTAEIGDIPVDGPVDCKCIHDSWGGGTFLVVLDVDAVCTDAMILGGLRGLGVCGECARIAAMRKD